MLRMDHRYNNPICMVFFEILMARLREVRRSSCRWAVLAAVPCDRGGQKDAMAGALVVDEQGMDGDRLTRASGAALNDLVLERPAGGLSAARRRWLALRASLVGVCRHRVRQRCRCLTRWQLARLLLFNPKLRKYRRGAESLLAQQVDWRSEFMPSERLSGSCTAVSGRL
jgi:hypothetical protein